MRIESADGRPGLVAAALAWAEDWLFEPLAPPVARPLPAPAPARPVVAVLGLRERCGASTVARALAARLASRDQCGAAIVAGSVAAPQVSPALPAPRRLAAQVCSSGAAARAAGRLCLTDTRDHGALATLWRGHAPIVLDLAPDLSPVGAVSLADVTILVAPGDGEPALAELAARSLARDGREPVTVVSRAGHGSGWGGRAALLLPGSRAGALLAAAGWPPPGALGTAAAELGELCRSAACA